MVTLATDLAVALDPVRFALAAGLDPDPWQADVLRSGAARQLLNCTRQGGKSTVTAALATHTAIYVPGSLTLLLSPSQRQSGELFRKCLDLYSAAGRPVDPEAESALRIELINGSRIVALPGKEGTIRGYSGARLIIVDEASRVDDALYYSVRPMLAVSGGRLVALSTPFGKRGWWFEEWQNGGPGWERTHITADACPRIPRAFLDEERQSLGEWWYRQEYYGEFMDAQGAVFRYEDIERAFSNDLQPLFGA